MRWHGFCICSGMREKTTLIAGGTGFMRQYIVDNLLSDPENVVIGVDLLTAAGVTHNDHENRSFVRTESMHHAAIG